MLPEAIWSFAEVEPDHLLADGDELPVHRREAYDLPGLGRNAQAVNFARRRGEESLVDFVRVLNPVLFFLHDREDSVLMHSRDAGRRKGLVPEPSAGRVEQFA